MQILYKYCANIVQILCKYCKTFRKYCANIVQMLFKCIRVHNDIQDKIELSVTQYVAVLLCENPLH